MLSLQELFEDDESDSDDSSERELVITAETEPNHSSVSNSTTTSDQESNNFPVPSYYMKAILAGLYEIPPDHILRHQTGWGRKIRYDRVCRLESSFPCIATWTVGDENSSSTTSTILRIDLHQEILCRHQNFDPDTDLSQQMAEFAIYRARINDVTSLNQRLTRIAMQDEQQQPSSLNVSNAGGGWHGPPHFFNSSCEDDAQFTLWTLVKQVIQAIEARQEPVHELNLSQDNVEAWINISRHEAWNRLHTHQGSAWSGVYYVQCPSSSTATSGRLVLKPTSHPVEDAQYSLSLREQERFRNVQSCLDGCSKGTVPMHKDMAAFLDIVPEPGDMIVFPSWLHHCVLPSICRGGETTEQDGNEVNARISIAFNINWKEQDP